MFVEGKYNTAICYTPALEPHAEEQIRTVCDQEAFSGCQIRIMPDVHAGKGCTIGTTMTITDKIVPAMVGVDIGCGMETVLLHNKQMDLEKLDACIHKRIPSGFAIRDRAHPFAEEIDLSALRCASHVNITRAYRSIGTLGGGNHFIEINRGDGGELYLVIHSGSRHLGLEVAAYYQKAGYQALCSNAKLQLTEEITQLKAEGKAQEIQHTVAKFHQQNQSPVPEDLAYVQGALFADYLHDMKIVQRFAVLNRKAMAQTILNKLCLAAAEEFTTIHNYIDTEEMILRKGAVSAKDGEKLLIPMNMRDGSLICVGKGNTDWNCSAPHGAGRLMSRSAAFHQLDMQEYQIQMRGIYSTCVVPETLDESPMAYKPMDEILGQIAPTAEILEKIKPVYNFKAAEGPVYRKR